MTDDNTLRETAREQDAAAKIIAKVLIELRRMSMTDAQAERNARAIIARLAHNDPPLLVVFIHNVKERGE